MIHIRHGAPEQQGERGMVIPTLKLYEDDAYLRRTTSVIREQTERAVLLEATPFYAESGGQPGDRGVLVLDDGQRLTVTDTVYLPGRMRIAHVLAEPARHILVGRIAEAEIDWERRHRLMRMHTCLHLLCALIDAPVTGCAMAPESGRLDFDLEGPLDREDLSERLRRAIESAAPVEIEYRTAEDMRAASALVRTVQAAPPDTGDRLRLVHIHGLDLQPCGGTHVRNTAEIGDVVVTNVQKKGRHNRRVKVAFTDLLETALDQTAFGETGGLAYSAG